MAQTLTVMDRNTAPDASRSGGTVGEIEHTGFADDFSAVLESTSTQRSTIGCIIPAYNEEASIAGVITSLLAQTRVPDVIHVVVNNTTDATVRIASEFAGPHEVRTELG